MNAVNRLLALVAVAAASTASVPKLWPQLGPQADLWKVPAHLSKIHSGFDKADALDSQFVLLQRLRCAREFVIEALLQNRLTASQAVERFRELNELRTEAGLPTAAGPGKSPSEIARREVLSHLREMLKTAPSWPGNASLNQALRELNAPTTGSTGTGRLH
jgi:hypothetical protein